MLTLSEAVIADASCFILLDKIGELELLQQVFDQVVTTPEIAAEYGKQLPNWVCIEQVENTLLLKENAEKVDLGEASAITLYFEKQNAVLLLDDLQGRKLAQKLQLRFTGTLGLIAKAKKEGFIKSVKPIT